MAEVVSNKNDTAKNDNVREAVSQLVQYKSGKLQSILDNISEQRARLSSYDAKFKARKEYLKAQREEAIAAETEAKRLAERANSQIETSAEVKAVEPIEETPTAVAEEVEVAQTAEPVAVETESTAPTDNAVEPAVEPIVEEAVQQIAPETPEIAETSVKVEESKTEKENKVESAPVKAVETPAAPQKTEEELKAEKLASKYNFPTRRIYVPPVEEKKPQVQKRPNVQTRVFGPDENFGRGAKRPPFAQNGDGQSRPSNYGSNGGGRYQRPAISTIAPPPVQSKAPARGGANKRKQGAAQVDERNKMNKFELMKKGIISSDYGYDDDASGIRMKARKKNKNDEYDFDQNIVIDHAVITTPTVSVKALSEKLGKTGVDIIKKLFILGIEKKITEDIDFEVAELVSDAFGITLEYKPDKTFEDTLSAMVAAEDEADAENMIRRPPIVTIMGHVDHGKTSLLDYIRKSNVARGEAGGITQHIGAYTISLDGQKITFLDTPGHQAFAAMRRRGAQVTDVAVLVVAADDGIMPQTVEAIRYAKEAGVAIVVAVNKIDKPAANPDRVLQQLTEYELVPEQWGGDTQVAYVSAKTGEGVETLLKEIIAASEISDLDANPKRHAIGTVIEARLDKGKGPLATVLVKTGTLKVGDNFVVGQIAGKVRAMTDDKGRQASKATPSMPVVIMGLSDVPNAGDILHVVTDDKLAHQIADERKRLGESVTVVDNGPKNMDEFFKFMKAGETNYLNLIIKADVKGSLEALKGALEGKGNDEVRVRIISTGVGAITESDVNLANSSDAFIIGFNIRPDNNAKQSAERLGVDVRCYRIIYDVIDEVNAALSGMLNPELREEVIGRAEVRQLFKISSVGTIAGCHVVDGRIEKSATIRVIRDGKVEYEGAISSLKREKNDAKEVKKDFDCGILIEGFNDIEEHDILEAFTSKKFARTIDVGAPESTDANGGTNGTN